MDRKQRVEKQVRLVLAIYRVEVRRLDSDNLARFRDRAQAIFDSLAGKNADDPQLTALILAARWELRQKPPSARGSLHEQAVNGGSQLDDREGLP